MAASLFTTRVRALQKAILKVSESALDAKERAAAQEKINKAFWKVEDLARREGEDQAPLKALWSAKVAAFERAADNYRDHLASESARLRQVHRQALPVPGTHDAEMYMLGEKYRSGRDSVRSRRTSQSQKQRLAGLRWNKQYALEALRAAVDMQNWKNVIKYAEQLQKLEVQEVRSSGLGLKRSLREFDMRSRQNHEAQARGRRGIP